MLLYIYDVCHKVVHTSCDITLHRCLLRAVSSLSLHDSGEQFRVYHGEWKLGAEDGYGIDVDNSAVLIGSSVDGRKEGHATIEYANGMSISGPLETGTAHLANDFGYDIFESPYLRSKHFGLVHITFADGSRYRGEMQVRIDNG